MARHYRYISADSHFESPPEQWTHRVPKQYRERAPRRIKLANDRDGLLFEGSRLVYGGTSLYGGRPPEMFDPTAMDFDRTPGCGSAEQRLREQDQDGIDAEILFALGVRNPAIRDTAASRAIVHGFNEYMAEEYCPVNRDRLITMAVLPNAGVAEDIEEMEFCKRMRFKGVWLSTYPSGKSFPTPEDDRFWSAALDLDMPVVVHTSFPAHVGSRETPLFKYPKEPAGEQRPPTDFVQRLARQGPYHSGAVEASQLIVAGVFERFPRLQIYWAENNVGWLPYFYEQMDHEYSVNRFWAERYLGLPRLKRLPSEYLREHAYWGFFEDHVGVRLRHEVGVDRMMWSTDFPHVVTRWPNSLRVLESQMANVPEEERHKMAAANAVKFFGLDHEPTGKDGMQ
ncbi:MAG TPA: amidohydrolase family protein [Candidatus Binatia bacterium]|nr:amidohydrolase family protein [Candidatus Binatia bacterium]